ncbi:AAA family ATPase [Candidatus Saccharibacteria bacterium]|nr:AAA family ATPase [Candidatus Saccharibacteria bacterium]
MKKVSNMEAFCYYKYMSIISITGHPGTGKSTILKKLFKLGYVAYGVDEEKAASYSDLNTNQPTVDIPIGVNRNMEWRKANVWRINMDIVRSLSLASGSQPTFIFCNGQNVEDVWDYSDKVIILTLSNEETRERLTTRTSNSFGSHPGELELAEQMSKTIYEKSKEYTDKNIYYIDTTKRLNDIVDEILSISNKSS